MYFISVAVSFPLDSAASVLTAPIFDHGHGVTAGGEGSSLDISAGLKVCHPFTHYVYVCVYVYLHVAVISLDVFFAVFFFA